MLVPKGHVEDQTREQACLKHPQEEPHGSDAREVGCATQPDSDGPPGEHQESEPSRGPQLLEQNVGGDFEKEVGDEEDHQGNREVIWNPC